MTKKDLLDILENVPENATILAFDPRWPNTAPMIASRHIEIVENYEDDDRNKYDNAVIISTWFLEEDFN